MSTLLYRMSVIGVARAKYVAGALIDAGIWFEMGQDGDQYNAAVPDDRGGVLQQVVTAAYDAHPIDPQRLDAVQEVKVAYVYDDKLIARLTQSKLEELERQAAANNCSIKDSLREANDFDLEVLVSWGVDKFVSYLLDQTDLLIDH